MNTMGQYDGMSVNERLFSAGLIDAFDKAAKTRNRNDMIGILGQVELLDEAESIVDAILASPVRYGY